MYVYGKRYGVFIWLKIYIVLLYIRSRVFMIIYFNVNTLINLTQI